jgi:DNA phosphorothioation-dependent restriction protein DptH
MSAVNWTLSTAGSPHAVIVGIPGQGKSVSTQNIVRQLHQQNIATLSFDFHGDMSNSAHPEAVVVDIGESGLPFSPFEIRSTGSNPAKAAALEIADILTVVGSLGEIQRHHVYSALLASYEKLGWVGTQQGSRLPRMDEFVANLKNVEGQQKGKNAEARLMDITEFDLFRDEEAEHFDVLRKSGTIFRVDSMGSEAVKLAAGAFLLRKIYNEMFRWGHASSMRLVVVLDEAHLLAKDVTIPKLMKEGRKFGISLLLVSQSLDDFRSEVLENAGTKIAFRTNFPSSKKIAQLLGGSNVTSLASAIEKLQVGEAYVSASTYGQPKKTKMQAK